jgi:hypothetical protein
VCSDSAPFLAMLMQAVGPNGDGGRVPAGYGNSDAHLSGYGEFDLDLAGEGGYVCGRCLFSLLTVTVPDCSTCAFLLGCRPESSSLEGVGGSGMGTSSGWDARETERGEGCLCMTA